MPKSDSAIDFIIIDDFLTDMVQCGAISFERQSRSLIYKPEPVFVNELIDFLSENCCGGEPCGMPKAAAVSVSSLKKKKSVKA
jgi:hypothetical protein